MSNVPGENRAIELRRYMRSDQIVERFREVVGGVNANAYISSVILAVANSDKLQECEPRSIVTSALRAATLRLSCDPVTGQAHLVPYKGKATLQIGYKGLRDMAIRTGQYRYLNVATVYEGQTVEEDQLKGIHTINGYKTSDKPIGYMLYFELRNGFSKTFYMTVEEIHAHAKKYSKSYSFNDAPWKTATVQMEKKTVLRLGLTRWGYLDPADVMVINSEEDPDDIPDISEARKEPLNITPAQAMRELYGDGEPIDAETTPVEQPSILNTAAELGGVAVEQPSAVMTLEMAEGETNSRGEKYGDLDTQTLANMANSLKKKFSNGGFLEDEVVEKRRKLDAILVILASRQK